MTLLDTISKDIRNWWLFLLKGLFLLVVGILVFRYPVSSYVGLSIWFGAAILVSGLAQLFFSLTNTSMKGWGWTLVSGIIDLIIGVYLLTYPELTLVTLPLFVGFWWLFRSFYLMGISFDLKDAKIRDWGWLLAGSVLLLITALFVLAYPAAGAIGIISVTAAALIIGGILNVVLAFKLKGLYQAVPHAHK
jgi:uncharacterized membrane protein HdeD (DUF308 family)